MPLLNLLPEHWTFGKKAPEMQETSTLDSASINPFTRLKALLVNFLWNTVGLDSGNATIHQILNGGHAQFSLSPNSNLCGYLKDEMQISPWGLWLRGEIYDAKRHLGIAPFITNGSSIEFIKPFSSVTNFFRTVAASPWYAMLAIKAIPHALSESARLITKYSILGTQYLINEAYENSSPLLGFIAGIASTITVGIGIASFLFRTCCFTASLALKAAERITYLGIIGARIGAVIADKNWVKEKARDARRGLPKRGMSARQKAGATVGFFLGIGLSAAIGALTAATLGLAGSLTSLSGLAFMGKITMFPALTASGGATLPSVVAGGLASTSLCALTANVPVSLAADTALIGLGIKKPVYKQVISEKPNDDHAAPALSHVKKVVAHHRKSITTHLTTDSYTEKKYQSALASKAYSRLPSSPSPK